VKHDINIFLKKIKNIQKKKFKKKFKKKSKNSKKWGADTWHLLNGVSSILTERT